MNSSNLISIIGANFVKKDPSCCNKSLDEICPYSAEAWAGKRLLGMLPSRTKSWFCDSFSLRIADGLLGQQPRSGGARATPDTRTSLAMLLPYEQSIILCWLGHWHWKYKWEQVWNTSIYVERGLSLRHGDQTRTHIYVWQSWRGDVIWSCSVLVYVGVKREMQMLLLLSVSWSEELSSSIQPPGEFAMIQVSNASLPKSGTLSTYKNMSWRFWPTYRWRN